MAYRISDVVSKTGFSAPTLRYYEQIRLLPAPERTAAGYRAFTEEHVRLLEFISRAKRLGLPLEEIRILAEAWGRQDCRATREQLVSVLESKLAQIRHRIGDLVALREQLEGIHGDLCGRPAPVRCGPECGCDIEVRQVDLDTVRELTLISLTPHRNRG